MDSNFDIHSCSILDLFSGIANSSIMDSNFDIHSCSILDLFSVIANSLPILFKTLHCDKQMNHHFWLLHYHWPEHSLTCCGLGLARILAFYFQWISTFEIFPVFRSINAKFFFASQSKKLQHHFSMTLLFCFVLRKSCRVDFFPQKSFFHQMALH